MFGSTAFKLALAVLVAFGVGALRAEEPKINTSAQIKQMQQLSERLEKQGNLEAAARIREHVRELENLVSQSKQRQQEKADPPSTFGGEAGSVENFPVSGQGVPGGPFPVTAGNDRLRHLRMAIENLKAAGLADQAQALQRQAEQLEREQQIRAAQSNPGQFNGEAMKMLEAMAREQQALREQVEALKKEVASLRETLLRLPPPAMPLPVGAPPFVGSPFPAAASPPMFGSPEYGQFRGATYARVLDRDKDGAISADELQRHKSVRELFSKYEIELTEPMPADEFAATYARLIAADREPGEQKKDGEQQKPTDR